ncbi:MAG: hypothetical protein ACD_51C00160G0002 [uncultured bacterium]|nr:MAG: hypothetical protein ACD_51C00160G0002 [uncultured bacterium]
MIIREYLNGIPIGVTVFLDKDGNYFLSGMRRQCFSYKGCFPDKFLGIQWLKHDFFPEPTIEKITSLLERLAEVFISENFIGVANVDIVVYEGLPYLLECNPRMSSATQHLFSVSQLCGIDNPWLFFLNTFCDGKNEPIRNGRMPLSDFEGCLMDIDIKGEIRVDNMPPVGIYTFEGGNIRFISDSISDLNRNQDFFFLFHEFSDAEAFYSDITLCTVINNSPLFNLDTGKLNRRGEKIFGKIRDLIV